MSLFCGSGVSWGRRRRALTRGASHRRKRTSSKGISTQDLSTSDEPSYKVSKAPEDAIPASRCGCGSRRKRHTKEEGTPTDSGSGDYGGVFMGSDNDWEPKTSAAMESIVYFEDNNNSLGQSYMPSEPDNNSQSGTEYEPTPQPTRPIDTPWFPSDPDVPHQESTNNVNPSWVRQRRHLPTADDVDIDRIDDISLNNSVFATPAHLKALVGSPQFQMSPVYENLVDKNLSDVYLQAQMKAVVYSSTPMPANCINVEQPPVMTATSGAIPGVIRGKQVDSDTQIKSPLTLKMRSPFKQLNFNTPSILTQSKRSSRLSKLSPKKKKNCLLPKKGRASNPKDVYTVQGLNNQTVYENDMKENDPGIIPKSSLNLAHQKRRSSGAPRRLSDLRRTTLTRNMLYGPQQKRDAHNMFHESYMHDSQVQSGELRGTNVSPNDEPTPLTFANAMKQFEKLTVSSQPSGERSLSSSSSSSSSGDNTTFRTSDLMATPMAATRRGRIVHDPKFADNSARKARIVSISPSSVDFTSSESSTDTSTSSAPRSAKDSKLGTSWSASAIHPGHDTRQRAVTIVDKSREGSNIASSRQLKSETNIRNAETILSHQPKPKVRAFNENPRQVTQAPTRSLYATPSSGLSPIEEIPSPPNRKVPISKEPSGQGLILFNFSQLSEGDVSVKRGESVTILNFEDEDWLYVRPDNEANKEGFVPRSYVFITPQAGPPSPTGNATVPNITHRPYQTTREDHGQSQPDGETSHENRRINTLPRAKTRPRVDKQRRQGPSDRYLTLVETYVVVGDHVAGQIDECNVKVGDIVFVNSKQQISDQIDWMWVMVVGSGKTGYIPAFSARPANFQASNV